MSDFAEKLRLKGKAEEDLFFAELDRHLIEALHEKEAHNIDWASEYRTKPEETDAKKAK